MPPSWVGRRLTLVIGAAYWHTRVWIDGLFVGEHEGGYDPIVVDVPAAVAIRGSFVVTVRVWAPDDTDEFPHGKNTDHWYTRVAGVWQSVYLEAGGPVATRELAIDPDPCTGEVRVRIRLDGRDSHPVSVEVSSRDADGRLVGTDLGSVTDHVDGYEVEAVLRIDEVHPWSPAHPNLYDLRVRVRSSGHIDDVWSYFGFRSVGFDETDGRRLLHIDGEPCLVRGVMVQGYDRGGLYTLSDERMRSDLAAARELGFNLVRVHCKVEAPRFHYWADRIGMLLWCEVPNHLTPSAAAQARWEAAWIAMLERDRNHPSIVLWGMFIESWGLGRNQFGFGDAENWFAEDAEMQRWVTRMHEVGRRLDTTRPIIENSVSEFDHITIAEVNDFHLFPSGYAELPEAVTTAMADFVDHAFPGSQHNFARGHVQADQPLLASSCAGWSSVDGVETSWPMRVLLNALRREPKLAGFGWVQLYDIEWEYTGLLDYDRRHKAFGYAPTELTDEDVLVLDSPLTASVEVNETLAIRPVAACSSGRAIGAVRLRATWEGVGPDAGTILRPALEVEISEPISGQRITRLGEFALRVPDVPLAGELRLELTDSVGTPRLATRVAIEVRDVKHPGPGVALPLESWAAHGSEVARLVVNGRTQLLAARQLSIQLPEGAPTVLELEVALEVGPERQTIDGPRISPIGLRGAASDELLVVELRRDSSGVLSVVNGVARGAYGEVASIALPYERPGPDHTVVLEAAEDHARVVIFGSRLGRYPFSPRLLL